ncbi:MAG TPA: efflux RND transporter periplasmic adaptor subunit [Burkholderiales bacterium]|nr:efflux RND transporter periplasmic adaptor subunit [Burkholderiales bacterium]
MDSLFSSRWYRVAGLHPRLRGHVRVSRHVYRGQIWYLLQDTSSGRHHRVDEAAFHFIGRMDGQRAVDEIWHALLNSLGDRAPTQDDSIEILCQLSDSGLLQCEITPDVAELFRRSLERGRKRRMSMLNPLSFRVPLFDPDALLNRLAPVALVLFQPALAVVWGAVVLAGLLAVVSNWNAVGSFAVVHMLTPRYLLLLWLCYPVIKVLHELGHALAVKAWGGEVREMGLSLLLLVPVPFVDASAASAFPEKHRRVIVGAAGIMVELFLAALAALVWLHVQEGTVRDIAFVAMLIGGMSTVLFNGNPLLRFDGYYVLSDLLDVPNLGPRATAYIGYLAQRKLLAVKTATSPVTGPGEGPVLFCYAVLSYAYRWFIAGLIILWAGHFSFWTGILAGAAVAATMALKPLAGLWRFLTRAPQIARTRTRSMAVAGGIAATILILLCVVPFPFATRAQGVVWLPEQARIRAGTDGFVTEVLAKDGQAVKPGDPVLVLADPDLIAERQRLEAQIVGLDVEFTREVARNAARAKSIAEDTAAKRAELAQVEKRLDSLRVVSETTGTLVLPRAQDLPGSFVAKGTVLANVLRPDEISVKVAVPQEDAGLIRSDTREVQVTLADLPGSSLEARFTGEVPAATSQLPTAALGDRAGGPFVTDPADKEGVKTLEPVFLLDLRLTSKTLERVGGRAWLRFDHGARPLAFQWHRRMQQLFLKQFNPEG